MAKTMRQKMEADGLTSYIVTYISEDDVGGDFMPDDDTIYEMEMQFWAEDSNHASEQLDDSEPCSIIRRVETQDEYEARTGVKLDYGRKANR